MGLDPRLAAGYRLTDWISLKASIGVFHGPPRVTWVFPPLVIGPVPGAVGAGLERGLSRSIQSSAGVDMKLPHNFELRLQGFYSHMTTGVDFSLMSTQLESGCVFDCPKPTDLEPEVEKNSPPLNTVGRSYGMEFMLRRRLGDSVFGWLTYSLTRSERDVAGFGTLPFLFDQTHVLNVVASWEVGRSWTLGATYHFNTGRPYTPMSAAACDGILPPPEADAPDAGVTPICLAAPLSGRLPSYWRLDVRIQKRELFDTWYFDFYMDITNVTFNWEVVGYELQPDGTEAPVEAPIFIPMVGLRGRF